MDSLLIQGGTVIDGSGSPGYKADIFISDGKIQNIGSIPDTAAMTVIDAAGLVVCPGFIDTHVHNETCLLFDRQHTSGLSQGVTTEIMGNCGLSFAPMSGKWVKDTVKMYAGAFGNPPGICPDWTTVKEFLARYDECTAINVAYSTPHNAIRLGAVGFHNIPLHGYLMDKAKKTLRASMEEGSLGFNTGLSYYPASYADTDEIAELCKVVAENNGIFTIHLRTEFHGERFDPAWEAMEIARRSGVKLHISHIKTGRRNMGRTDLLLKGYEDAASQGVDISFELYPYHAGSGFLVVFLPGWSMEGGYDYTIERLNNDDVWADMEKDVTRLYNTIYPDNNAVITHIKNQPEYIGMWLKDIARVNGCTIAQVIRSLLVNNDLEVGIRGQPIYSDEELKQLDTDILELLKMKNYMVGSDSCPAGEKPHPRAFGTFPKLLRLSRERKFPLETIINRMTMTPARRFRLDGRGSIAKGMFADIVVFDPETVCDTSTWECPRSMPEGIKFVLVNGRVAVRNERVTGILAGKALKRG